MWKPATALRVPRHDRELLGFLSRAPKTPQRVALRARIVLGAAAGRSINGLARELEVGALWRRRYHEAGIGGLLQDAPRPGRKKAISAKKVETLVNATLHTTPDPSCTRAMPAGHGRRRRRPRRRGHGLHPRVQACGSPCVDEKSHRQNHARRVPCVDVDMEYAPRATSGSKLRPARPDMGCRRL